MSLDEFNMAKKLDEFTKTEEPDDFTKAEEQGKFTKTKELDEFTKAKELDNNDSKGNSNGTTNLYAENLDNRCWPSLPPVGKGQAAEGGASFQVNQSPNTCTTST